MTLPASTNRPTPKMSPSRSNTKAMVSQDAIPRAMPTDVHGRDGPGLRSGRARPSTDITDGTEGVATSVAFVPSVDGTGLRRDGFADAEEALRGLHGRLDEGLRPQAHRQ